MHTSEKINEVTQRFWVYILLCDNGHYYTGYTHDLERRYQEHVRGTSKCKYTRSFKPVKLAQSWEFSTKSAAMQVEKKLKSFSRKEKEFFILHPEELC